MPKVNVNGHLDLVAQNQQLGLISGAVAKRCKGEVDEEPEAGVDEGEHGRRLIVSRSWRIAAEFGWTFGTPQGVDARIADRTVSNEYFAVSEKVEALYDQPRELPADAEGREMAKLRRQMHQRMVGNGYCARRSSWTATSSRSASPAPTL